MTNYPVKQPLLSRPTRAALSLIALFAWLHAANHCAVASLLQGAALPAAEEQSCPGHKSTPQEQKGDGCDANSCCKSFAAPLLTKVVATYDALSFLATDFGQAMTFDLGEQHLALIAEIDTGPPDHVSFAESVLQRSLLAHAPPSPA